MWFHAFPGNKPGGCQRSEIFTIENLVRTVCSTRDASEPIDFAPVHTNDALARLELVSIPNKALGKRSCSSPSAVCYVLYFEYLTLFAMPFPVFLFLNDGTITTGSKDTARDHIQADEGSSAESAALATPTGDDDHRGAADSDGEVNIRYTRVLNMFGRVQTKRPKLFSYLVSPFN